MPINHIEGFSYAQWDGSQKPSFTSGDGLILR